MFSQRFAILAAFVAVTISPGLAVAQEVWSARKGTVTLKVPYDTLERHALWMVGRAVPTTSGDLVMTLTLTLDEAAALEFTVDADGSVRLLRRYLRVLEGITIGASEANHPVFDLTIAAGEEVGPEGIDDLQGIARGIPTLELRGMKAGFNHRHSTLTVAGREVVITPELADALGRPELAGVSLGRAEVSAVGEWIGGDAPAPFDPFLPDGGGVTRGGLPDVTFCQLYGLGQHGQRDGIVGLSIATTSWNVGTGDLAWFARPSAEHPFIVMDVFRLKTVDGSERFEQIGQSWIKHAFTALTSTQCGGFCTFEPGHSGGNWLGMNCTDTYGASLNAIQSGLGPRFEVDPWTGGWSYEGSHFTQGGSHDGQIDHRLQVHDADLDPDENPGATYYGSSFYVAFDDVDAMNSVAWKTTTVSGSPGGTWSFSMSGPGTFPNIGFPTDVWEGATQTLLAQEIPVIEFESPDGRCILAAEATDLGGGTWHYEYALLNVDMDRQVGSFGIPIAGRTTVTNVGFHAVEHHDEQYNTVDDDQVEIDNAPWDWEVTDSAVTWSTTSNPLRWGTMYNFRFDATSEPADTTVTLGLFRTGTPSTVTGATVGPTPLPPDCNDNGIIDRCDVDCGSAGGECDVPGCGGSQDCDGNNVPDDCQTDFDGDGTVDDCDDDTDNDGVLNDVDVCDYTPLGTPVRENGASKGDLYSDCDVDLDDYRLLDNCIAGGGPGAPADPTCLDPFDFNYDADVDLEDVAGFQNVFTGPD